MRPVDSQYFAYSLLSTMCHPPPVASHHYAIFPGHRPYATFLFSCATSPVVTHRTKPPATPSIAASSHWILPRHGVSFDTPSPYGVPRQTVRSWYSLARVLCSFVAWCDIRSSFCTPSQWRVCFNTPSSWRPCHGVHLMMNPSFSHPTPPNC